MPGKRGVRDRGDADGCRAASHGRDSLNWYGDVPPT
jgi:hypothetical protein